MIIGNVREKWIKVRRVWAWLVGSRTVILADQLWVAGLRISAATSRKIAQKHGITADEVYDHVVCARGLRYTWDNDPERGLRALVETRIRGKRVLVVLYPTSNPNNDVYNLGSAYFVEGERVPLQRGHDGGMSDNDFYEADEPVNKIIAAFERGEKGLTGPRAYSRTERIEMPLDLGKVLSDMTNKSTTELLQH